MIGFVLLACPLASQAIIRYAGCDDQLLLQLGQQYPAVGRIDFNPSTNDYRSCVLIGDKWILTAGHNFVSATTSKPIRLGTDIYNAVYWVRHPNYNVNALENGYDLCVARLDRRVTNIAPAQIYRGTSEQGKIGTVVGYGASGNGTQSMNDFTKRAGTNLIEMLYSRQSDNSYLLDWPNALVADFDDGTTANNALTADFSPISNAAKTYLECNFGNGDSGGGLFLDDGTGIKLAGITSARFRVDSGTNYYIAGTVDLFSRVSGSATWIDAQQWEAGSVSGTVQYQNFVGDITQHPLTVKITNPGSATVLETQTVTPNIGGTYSFVSSLRGTYDIYFKADHWLRAKKASITISSSSTKNVAVSLVNGDCNGDNSVDSSDYFVLSDAYETTAASPTWNALADLNGDGTVDAGDYFILSDGYGVSGANIGP